MSETLADRGLRLVLAESCSGGLLAAAFTDRPGASRFLDSSVITYSDEAKQRLLGVQPRTLALHGAVSEPVVRAMAGGALRHGDVAVAVTGIAGPDGGTPEKPVGTVWIAAALPDGVTARRYQFEGDRGAVRRASVDAAIALLDSVLRDGP
ncbi:MAG: CinA family protein [Gemmatimonadota bacterium]